MAGPTAASAKAAEPLYEVELEFCGQELWPADADRARHAQYLTDSMLMKVADLVRQVADAANPPAQGGGGLKRRRPDEPASGELRPGEVVTMAPPGAAVALEPSVPARRRPSTASSPPSSRPPSRGSSPASSRRRPTAAARRRRR